MENRLSLLSTEIGGNDKTTYSVLETVDFFSDQLKAAQMAQNRIWIQTMALESGHFSDLLAHHLIAAQERGVDVRIVYDAYSDYVNDNTFNNIPLLKKNDRMYKGFLRGWQREMLDLLRENCSVVKTNTPKGPFKAFPLKGVSGRDHKKITIVDEVAYIGGVNMAPLDAQRADFMMKTNNQAVVGILTNIFSRSFFELPVHDASYVCDKNNTILVDAGNRGKSIVMTYTCNEVDKEEKRVILISPFLPSGKLRKTLNHAVQRGVEVDVITSRHDQSGLTPRISQVIHDLGQEMPLFNINRYPGIIHAKAILFGERTAIIGSHNFDDIFVRLGTEEISLLTTQPEIVSQLVAISQKMQTARS